VAGIVSYLSAAFAALDYLKLDAILENDDP
jgi:hypothetical protein